MMLCKNLFHDISRTFTHLAAKCLEEKIVFKRFVGRTDSRVMSWANKVFHRYRVGLHTHADNMGARLKLARLHKSATHREHRVSGATRRCY